MNYKEIGKDKIEDKTRFKILCLQEEKEPLVPPIPIEKIYERLSSEIEEPEEHSHDILKNIIYAQYYLNDPNIGNNYSYQTFLRKMRNIIINPNKKYSITIQRDAMFLIDKFMETEDGKSIHFIRSLDMTDGFLTLFNEIDDECLLRYLLRFFWLIAGHCTDCNDYFVKILKEHEQIFDKIEKYIRDTSSKTMTKSCIIFLKNLANFKLKSKFANTIASYFLYIILNNEINPPPSYYVHSIYGLCQIIRNNENHKWRNLLQEELTNNISKLLSIGHPKSIYAFLLLIYWWYMKGEILEDFNTGIIVDFLMYKDEQIKEDYIFAIRSIASQIIEILASKGYKSIEPLIENDILEATLLLYPESNFRLKKSIVTYSFFIAKNAHIDDKRKMVELGFIQMFIDSFDEIDEVMTCKILEALIYLFQACEIDGHNVCIDIIQEIPEFQIVYDIAKKESELKSTNLARFLIDNYIIDME